MNEKQKKWTIEKCEMLLGAAKDFDLTEHDFDVIVSMTNKFYGQSKGNEEVKQALLETVTYIENMYNIFKR